MLNEGTNYNGFYPIHIVMKCGQGDSGHKIFDLLIAAKADPYRYALELSKQKFTKCVEETIFVLVKFLNLQTASDFRVIFVFCFPHCVPMRSLQVCKGQEVYQCSF